MKAIALSILAATTLGSTLVFNPSSASAGEVANREHYQQTRIWNGVRDGQISRREFGQLERREGIINRQRLADLRANGGHLTPQEYRQLNRELNGNSVAIWRDRHN